MTEKDVLERAAKEKRVDLLPGLSEAELEKFARSLPAPLPARIRELLAWTSGFDIPGGEGRGPSGGGSFGSVRFTAYNDWGCEFLLPHAVVLNGDECGDSWAVEVDPETGEWHNVWFACHDPPVLVYHRATLAEYIDAVLDGPRSEERASGRRGIAGEAEERAMQVWRNRGKLPRAGSLRASGDPVLREFAAALDERALVADLREAPLGNGFSWASLADARPVKRAGTRLLFGIEPRPGLLARLLGR